MITNKSKPIRKFLLAVILAAVTINASAESTDELAARGETITNQDPIAMALREQQAAGPARRGFDIGMAIAEKDTLPGPGKKALHDSLDPSEQPGFESAVTYSLDRNRNAKLAAIGAAIAATTPANFQARGANPNPMSWLGFDIATGLFGNPAQGALGNTLTGPGSLKIRDQLNPAAQVGFNSSVKFHLGHAPPSAPLSAAAASSLLDEADGRGAAVAQAAAPRVPNVVGMSVHDAENLLHDASLTYAIIQEKEPDPSVTYGHVRATVPAAGRLVGGDEKIELLVPLAASKVGKSALALSDVERRAGFDLDAGQYEEVFRGADIILAHRNNEPYTQENGKTAYQGEGVFLAPSDGAVLYDLKSGGGFLIPEIWRDGIGSYQVQFACKTKMNEKGVIKSSAILISGDAYICVSTSEHQMAMVQFRQTDNPYNEVSNFQFHYAVFPSQLQLPAEELEKNQVPIRH